MGILTKELGLPESSPDAPNPNRCSESGKIAALLRQAGLRDVEQVELPTRRTYDSVGHYWEYMLDMNQTIAGAFAKAGDEKRRIVKLRLSEALKSFQGSRGEIKLDSSAWVCNGVK